VIKRQFGEHVTSRVVKTQNRELSFRCIAYNIHRLSNIVVIFRGLYKAKPSNFPMELLLYTDILFIGAGLAQIFWALPMMKGWGLRWYYLGIFGTAALSLSLLFTRLPNGGTALIDTNPMAM
jgi:hypothetical protein